MFIGSAFFGVILARMTDLVTALDGQMEIKNIEAMLQHADATGKVNFQTFKRIVLHGLKSTNAAPSGVVAGVANKAASSA